MRLLKSLFRRKRLDPYMLRDNIKLEDQLRSLNLTGQDFNRAMQFWKEFAKDYGIPPEKLRTDDKVADIVRTDFFGDRGLYFEKLLIDKGIKSFPIDNATLEYLIRQLL